MELKKTVDSIYNQAKQLDRSEGHMVLEGIGEDKDAIAVISVYFEQRPAHTVLNELYEWAELNELYDVVAKITELEEIK